MVCCQFAIDSINVVTAVINAVNVMGAHSILHVCEPQAVDLDAGI